MADENVPMPNELVVIRRRSGEEGDGHHGGAWKIAYADFMTAMMAFFLVMWLINTADKKTIERIATYFNPMRMADQSTHRKGLQDLDAEAVEGNIATVKTKEERTGDIVAAAKENAVQENKEPAEKAPAASHSKEAKEKAEKAKAAKEKAADKAADKAGDKSKEQAKEKSKAKESDPSRLTEPMEKVRGKERGLAAPSASLAERRFTDDELFSNPYGSLDRLAADADASELSPASAERAAAGRHREAAKKGGAGADPDMLRELAMPADVTAAAGQQTRATPPAPAGQSTSTTQAANASPDKSASPDAQQKSTPPPPATPADQAADTAQLTAAVSAEVAEITKTAKPGKSPHIEVTPTPEGTLISVTDEFDFGMFAIGSAEPRAELVAVMSRIGEILQKHGGNVILRGHTDGRQYKSGAWDNWRLSASRAQMAYHMLVRGGLEAPRIERIEGYADRSLKVAADPLAARNRRIEILLKGS